MKRILILWMCFLMSPMLFAGDDLPVVVKSFDSFLKSGDSKKGNASLFSFPITVNEIAYEQINEGYGCDTHVREISIKSFAQLRPYLERLQKVWRNPDPGTTSLAKFEDGSYGHSWQGDCEHVWSIQLNENMTVITSIQLDAENNGWSVERTDFK